MRNFAHIPEIEHRNDLSYPHAIFMFSNLMIGRTFECRVNTFLAEMRYGKGWIANIKANQKRHFPSSEIATVASKSSDGASA